VEILHILKTKGMYGTETNLLRTAEGLTARGHRVDFLLYVDPRFPVDGYVERLREAGCGVKTIPMRRSFSPAAFLRTVGFLRKHRYDVVHTHLVHGDFYGIAAAVLAGAGAVVSTKHNDDPFRRTFLFKAVERLLARRCTRVVVISRWLKRFNEEVVGIPGDKITVVYNGVNPRVEPGRRREDVREEWGAAAADVVFLAAARMIPQKGYPVLLDAFRSLAHRHGDARLVCLGAGEMEGELRARVAAAGLEERVLFAGYRDDVPSFMAAADVFVHPALWEGFGTVLIEAMRAGLPVVASAVSAVPEIVADGDTGFLVPPGDADALCGKMEILLRDPALRRAMGSRGAERVRECFTVDRMVRGFEEVYREAAGGGG